MIMPVEHQRENRVWKTASKLRKQEREMERERMLRKYVCDIGMRMWKKNFQGRKDENGTLGTRVD